MSERENLTAENVRLRHALASLAGYCLTCQASNTDAWMTGLTKRINIACKALDDPDRFCFGDRIEKTDGFFSEM